MLTTIRRSRDTEDLISKSKKQKARASPGSTDQTSNNIPEDENRKHQSTSVSLSELEHERRNGNHPQSNENPVSFQSSVTGPAIKEKERPETIYVQRPFTATTAAIREESVSAQESLIKERFQAVPTVPSPPTEKTNRSTSNVANTSRPQQVLPVAVSPLPRAQATATNARRLRTKVIFRACDKSLGYFKESDMRFESIDAFFEAITRQINATEVISRLTFDFGENSFKNVCVDKGDPDAHLDFQDILEIAKKLELEQSSDHLNIGLSF